MNSKQWLDDMIRAPRKKALPILSFPSVELIGTTVQEMVGNSELMARGMKAIADKVDSAASVSMMDLSVEAEAFGSATRCFANEVPAVTDIIVTDEASLKSLHEPHVGDGRTEIFVESVEKACKLITDRPVFAGIIGPYSLCGRLMGVSESMVSCISQPSVVTATLQKITPFLIEYAKAMKETGATGLIMAEPLTGLLSPKMATKFSEPYVKEIVDAVQDDNFIVIYHNCGGSVPKIIKSILNTGAYGYHFGNAIHMKDILTQIPDNVAVLGNIDPSSQFCMGTPETMRQAVFELLNECSPRHSNFIPSSGCDIAANGKWENIEAFFSAVTEYYNSICV